MGQAYELIRFGNVDLIFKVTGGLKYVKKITKINRTLIEPLE